MAGVIIWIMAVMQPLYPLAPIQAAVVQVYIPILVNSAVSWVEGVIILMKFLATPLAAGILIIMAGVMVCINIGHHQ
jgi:hypothetical protein